MSHWVLQKHRYQSKKFWGAVESKSFDEWLVDTANSLGAVFFETIEHTPNGSSSVAFLIGDKNE